MRKEKIETLTVAVLINNIEETIFSQLIELAKVVKALKIITNRPSNFSYIEQKLYDEYGIAIQITNNKEKALVNTKVIINFDFDEVAINEYKIFEAPDIVNIKYKTVINSSSFRGNVFDYYRITYREQVEENNCFDKNVMYESLIYRRDSFANIRKQFEIDGVEFKELIA